MIEFSCTHSEQLWNKIPKPVESREALPKWYKQLKGEAFTTDNKAVLTVKRCMPFFDGLSAGWLIPIPCDAHLEVVNNGSIVRSIVDEKNKDFHLNVILFHGKGQVKGHPEEKKNKAACKFFNPWVIKTPPGISCLFMPPIQQEDPSFRIIPAIVDTDLYNGCINFPFFLDAPDGRLVIKRGTYIAQVIPFQRETLKMEGIVQKASKELLEKVHEVETKTNEDGYYRKQVRDKRK